MLGAGLLTLDAADKKYLGGKSKDAAAHKEALGVELKDGYSPADLVTAVSEEAARLRIVWAGAGVAGAVDDGGWDGRARRGFCGSTALGSRSM